MRSARAPLRRRLATLSVAAAATVAAPVGLAACSSDTTPAPAPPSTSSPLTPTTPATPSPTPETFVVTGRPLRRRRGRLYFARSRTGGLWVTDAATLALPREVRMLLTDHWRRAGELEHASVVAFDDLARRLRHVRATDALVDRARQAATQEREHARRCFELASRYAGRRIAAGHLHLPLRRPRRRATEITALAVEALRDGVVNEGYAAWLAGAQLDRARDAEVRDTLTVIAADEAEHAELSRDVLEWCLLNGGVATQAAVDAAFAHLPQRMAGPSLPAAVPQPARVVLAAHGLVDVDPDGDGYRHVLASLVA